MGSAQNGTGDSSDNVTSPVTERGTWMIEYPRDHLPDEPLDRVLWAAFEFFARRDESNAALHMSPPRWSPITFRLADQLDAMGIGDLSNGELGEASHLLLRDVMRHRGQYEEDRGR